MAKKTAVEADRAMVAQEAGRAVVAPGMSAESWGAQPLSAKDIIIPKIMAMQGLSKLVTTGKAAMGEFRESLNGERLGSVDQPVEFIPFFSAPVWVTFEEVNGKWKYTGQVPITPLNDNLPYEEVVAGKKIRRDRSLNFYVLLPSEIAAGAYFPYMISFRRTSLQAGKKIATAFTKLAAFGRAPASNAFELMGVRQSNDKGTFIVSDVRFKRETTEAEIQACFKWYQTIAKSAVRVDDSDLVQESEVHAPADDVPYTGQF